MSNLNVESTLHYCSQWNNEGVSHASVGPGYATSRATTVTAKIDKCKSKKSAYAYFYGPNNHNAKRFIPIGMDTLIHEKPSKRKTFAQHCVKLWVLGTAVEHY